MEQTRIKEDHKEASLAEQKELCLHCGSSIHSHKTPTKGSSGRRFCCAGCRAVYELLQRKSLTSYYEVAARFGASITPLTAPNSDEPFIPPTDTDDLITFTLGGIQCASCVWLLERLPTLNDGVLHARVRLTHGDISVRYDSARTSPEEIARTIRTLGYSLYAPTESTSSQRTRDRESLIQLAIAGTCAMNIMVLAVSLYQGLFTGIDAKYETLFRWVSLALSIPVVGYSALPIYKKGIGALRTGALHIDLPITLGILLSFFLSALNTVRGGGEIYFDSVTTIIFLLLSTRHLQRCAFDSARRKCASRWSLLPSKITEITTDGHEREVSIGALRPGMIVSVKSGERIPCDGTIERGTSSLDCSTITGESLPVRVEFGTPVLAGSLNVEAPIYVRSTNQAGSSRLDRIVSAVTLSIGRPPLFITTLDTFSMLFTASALLLAGGAFLFSLDAGLHVAASAAIAMLTVTCPCAVALALPLLSIRALSTAAENGILVKSPDVFENLPSVSSLFFDKTGTLTTGTVRIIRFSLQGSTPREEIERIIAHLITIDPQHPVSRALKEWLPIDCAPLRGACDSKRIPGCGVSASFNVACEPKPLTAILASLSYIQSLNIQATNPRNSTDNSTSVVVLALNTGDTATFTLSDTLRSEVPDVVRLLSSYGQLSILSGDRIEVTREIARVLNIQAGHAYGGLLPQEKASIISATTGQSLFAGDGANDAPALRAATVGIALRGGIQSILESADVFVDRGGIEKIPMLYRIAMRYRRISRAIVGLGLFYNAVGIGAAFLGFISPLVAAVAMPIFSSILLIISHSAFVGTRSKDQNKWN